MTHLNVSCLSIVKSRVLWVQILLSCGLCKLIKIFLHFSHSNYLINQTRFQSPHIASPPTCCDSPRCHPIPAPLLSRPSSSAKPNSVVQTFISPEKNRANTLVSRLIIQTAFRFKFNYKSSSRFLSFITFFPSAALVSDPKSIKKKFSSLSYEIG